MEYIITSWFPGSWVCVQPPVYTLPVVIYVHPEYIITSWFPGSWVCVQPPVYTLSVVIYVHTEYIITSWFPSSWVCVHPTAYTLSVVIYVHMYYTITLWFPGSWVCVQPPVGFSPPSLSYLVSHEADVSSSPASAYTSLLDTNVDCPAADHSGSVESPVNRPNRVSMKLEKYTSVFKCN